MTFDPALIDQLKKETDLAKYIESRGISLTQVGMNRKGLCPFHEEKTPSFTVNPKENLWNCFGCGAGGDIFTFVERLDKLSFTQAVRRVAGKGTNLNGPKRVIVGPQRGETPRHDISPKHIKLLNRVVEFYHQEFFRDKRGLNYLRQRGITDKQSLLDFKVGFVAGNLCDILGSDNEHENALKEIGILNQNGHEMFFGSVVFPLFDFEGNCVGLYGRRIDTDQVSHLYLPGPRRGLVNRQAAKRSKTIILTESIIDALALYANGFKNVIPLYGTNGWSESHTELLKHHPVEHVYICFDNDEAGMNAGFAVKEKIKSFREAGQRIKAHIVKLPIKDVNDYFLKFKAGDFEELLKEANPQSVETGDSSSLGILKQERFYEPTEWGFILAYGKREYEIKGIARMGTQLKATIKASLNIKGPDKFQITTLDFYSLRSREWFAKVVADLTGERIELILEDLNRILVKLEDYQPVSDKNKKDGIKTLSEAEKEAALALLQNPKLLDEILADLLHLGFTGEETNKLLAYLVSISRKMEEPLSLLIQSRSAAGKSTLQDAILKLVPEEDCIKYTRLTDQALFYKDENSLKNKVLAIEEAAGIGGSAYSIRALQSSKQLTVATTSKDPATGKMKTLEYTVNGPLSIMMTTTDVALDAEMESRFLSVSIDETENMTKKIHETQRDGETLEGYLAKRKSELTVRKHQNAQRLLKPVVVVNPYAPQLKFPSDNLRSRRDHKKYLNLMKAICFLHQYQRQIKTTTEVGGEQIEYIEVTTEDIGKTNEIARVVLGHSLDELSAPSRTLLKLIQEMVKSYQDKEGFGETRMANFSFNRKTIREYAKWSDWQVKVHITELEELGYVYSHVGSKGKEYIYELKVQNETDGEEKVYLDLTDVSELKNISVKESQTQFQSEKVMPNLEGKKSNLVVQIQHLEAEYLQVRKESKALQMQV